MKRDFTRFVVSIMVFIAILFICDRIVVNVEDKLYARTDSKLNYATYGNNDEEIVILGSSRASHHYIPAIITDTTKMSCINLGKDGQNIYYHYALLNLFLAHNSPKCVIYELLSIDFLETEDKYSTSQLSALSPIFGYNHTVDSLMSLKKGYLDIVNIFNSYRYNGIVHNAIFGSFYDNMNNCGYIPIYGHWNGQPSNEETNDIVYDEGKLNCLYRFIDLCNKKGVKIIIAVSPTYLTDIANRDHYIQIGKTCENLGAMFFYKERAINDVTMFKDITHMNDNGARVYSSQIANELKHIMNL